MSNKRSLKGDNVESNANKLLEETTSIDDVLNYFDSYAIKEGEKISGASLVSKNHKENEKNGNEHIKDVESKTKAKYDNDEEVVLNKYENNDESQIIHDELETLNGMEMVEYDIEPSDQFKERAKNAMQGKSPDGELPGNAVESDFSKEFEKRIKNSKEKRDASKLNYVSMGKDMELLPDNKSMKNEKNLAFENHTHFAVSGNKILKGFKLNSDNLTEDVKNIVIPELKKLDENIDLKNTKIHSSIGLSKIGLSERDKSDWANNDEVLTEGDDYADSTHFAVYLPKNVTPENENLVGCILMTYDFSGDEYADYTPADFKESGYADVLDIIADEFPVNKSDFKLLNRKQMERNNIPISTENSFHVKNNMQPKTSPITEKVKVIRFKNKFATTRQAMSLIPESFKTEGNKFKMTDGDAKYLVEWKGNSIVGFPSIISEENPKLVVENVSKIKHLMAYNSLDEGVTMSDKQIQAEEDMLILSVGKNLRTLKEAKLTAEKKLISEGIDKKRKEKFQVRNINLNEVTKKYAKVKNASYIREGSDYLGVNYNVIITNTTSIKGEIMEQIRRENMYIVPSGRKVVFNFFDSEGNKL